MPLLSQPRNYSFPTAWTVVPGGSGVSTVRKKPCPPKMLSSLISLRVSRAITSGAISCHSRKSLDHWTFQNMPRG